MSKTNKITANKSGAKRGSIVSHVRKKETFKTVASPADQILHLQRTIGNQAVQRLFKSGTLQAKLKIGKPNDKYEKEADRVADIVMRMPEPKVLRQTEEEEEEVQPKPIAEQITPLIQRQGEEEEEEELVQTKPIAEQITPLVQRQAEPEEEEEEEEEPIQTKGNSSSIAVATPDIESSINSLRGGGRPLPESTRSYFEPRFGSSFNQVRVHTNSQAANIAKSINAEAFTTGKDVVFGTGQYSPENATGKHLLAHELTHVIQQRKSSPSLNSKEDFQNIGYKLKTMTEFNIIACNNEIDISPLTIQRKVTGDVTQMSISHQWAQDLTDEELQDQINIVRNQLLNFDLTAPEYKVALQNLEILEQEAFLRQATLTIDSPTSSIRFNINATPAMPVINCRARIDGNIMPNPTPTASFGWRIRVREVVAPDTCASARIGNCVLTVSQNNVIGGNWTPVFPRVQGGDAELQVSTVVRGRVLNAFANIHIRGTNPGVGAVTAACGGAGNEADRVACHESGRRQFGGGRMPLLGPGGDVGVMQLCNPAATCIERWHWRDNVTAGLTLLVQKQNAARRYLNRHVIAGNYPNSLGLNNVQVLQRETLQRYNGGRYWVWNAARNRWEPNPPNNYVAHVLAC